MRQRPLFLTEYALARILKEFALRLGMDDSLADVTAQVHLQQSTAATQWSAFIVRNCSECVLSPESCAFLNPQEHNCKGDATPDEVRAANAMVIEKGKLESCPAFMSE